MFIEWIFIDVCWLPSLQQWWTHQIIKWKKYKIKNNCKWHSWHTLALKCGLFYNLWHLKLMDKTMHMKTFEILFKKFYKFKFKETCSYWIEHIGNVGKMLGTHCESLSFWWTNTHNHIGHSIKSIFFLHLNIMSMTRNFEELVYRRLCIIFCKVISRWKHITVTPFGALLGLVL
jgi:hypothetical protein